VGWGGVGCGGDSSSGSNCSCSNSSSSSGITAAPVIKWKNRKSCRPLQRPDLCWLHLELLKLSSPPQEPHPCCRPSALRLCSNESPGRAPAAVGTDWHMQQVCFKFFQTLCPVSWDSNYFLVFISLLFIIS